MEIDIANERVSLCGIYFTGYVCKSEFLIQYFKLTFS